MNRRNCETADIIGNAIARRIICAQPDLAEDFGEVVDTAVVTVKLLLKKAQLGLEGGEEDPGRLAAKGYAEIMNAIATGA